MEEAIRLGLHSEYRLPPPPAGAPQPRPLAPGYAPRPALPAGALAAAGAPAAMPLHSQQQRPQLAGLPQAPGAAAPAVPLLPLQLLPPGAPPPQPQLASFMGGTVAQGGASPGAPQGAAPAQIAGQSPWGHLSLVAPVGGAAPPPTAPPGAAPAGAHQAPAATAGVTLARGPTQLLDAPPRLPKSALPPIPIGPALILQQLQPMLAACQASRAGDAPPRLAQRLDPSQGMTAEEAAAAAAKLPKPPPVQPPEKASPAEAAAVKQVAMHPTLQPQRKRGRPRTRGLPVLPPGQVLSLEEALKVRAEVLRALSHVETQQVSC